MIHIKPKKISNPLDEGTRNSTEGIIILIDNRTAVVEYVIIKV